MPTATCCCSGLMCNDSTLVALSMRFRVRREMRARLSRLGLATRLAIVALHPFRAMHAQDATAPASVAAHAVAPFFVGEKLEYDIKFSALKVGTGSMEVREITDVRGVPSWHTIFGLSGKFLFYKLNDKYESWFDLATLSSRRYLQDIEEGNYKPKRRYEIFPERSVYSLNGEPEQPSVADPLDDGSFLYFARTIPLEVGKTYTLTRYFKTDGNPVRITVLRKDTVDVPAGRFTAFVLQPTFQSKGLFSEDGHAEVWITDDDRRMMVQMKSKLSIGSINLYLRSFNARK